MGFCLFNNAAIAARHAIYELGLQRVAIIDWDVHHGNGTQEIFERDEKVLYMSVHKGGNFYPFTGKAKEVGEEDGEGFTVNCPFLYDGTSYPFKYLLFLILPEVICMSKNY